MLTVISGAEQQAMDGEVAETASVRQSVKVKVEM